MRNIFLFIRRYFTFLAFIALQAVALWLLFSYNRYHRAKGLGWANEITGRFNAKYKNVDDFFHLKAENERLHKFNDSLLNLLSLNYMKVDTGSRVVRDSIPFDTLGHYRQYIWRDARVVYSTVSADKNYIQLNRGSNNGIKDDMPVISSDGAGVGAEQVYFERGLPNGLGGAVLVGDYLYGTDIATGPLVAMEFAT